MFEKDVLFKPLAEDGGRIKNGLKCKIKIIYLLSCGSFVVNLLGFSAVY